MFRNPGSTEIGKISSIKKPAQLHRFSKLTAPNGNVLRDGTMIFKSIERQKFQKI
jgi:hypothetical protein